MVVTEWLKLQEELELNAADKHFCASSSGAIFIIPFVNMKIVMKPILLHFATVEHDGHKKGNETNC